MLLGDDDSALWRTGGSELLPKNTTEIVSITNETIFGPELPEPRYFHCLARVGSSTGMLIGGGSGVGGNRLYLRTTIVYDFDDQSWTPGPNLTYGRMTHSCGVIEDAEDGSQVVVVAGMPSRSSPSIVTLT